MSIETETGISSKNYQMKAKYEQNKIEFHN